MSHQKGNCPQTLMNNRDTHKDKTRREELVEMRCVIDELFTSTGTKTTTLHEDAFQHFTTSRS